MTRGLPTLLLLIARATDSELAKYVEFLKAENQMLRSKLPDRVKVTPAERERLLKLGKPLGSAINELISIVTPRTFLRWIKGQATGGQRRPRGRPRKPQELRELVVRMAKETSWGHRRIHGKLLKLGIRSISASTVSRILREHGIDPGPKRDPGSWHDFVQRHLKTLWACDFFTTDVWTFSGLKTFYVLFFLHVGSRRVYVAGVTANPNAHWMKERADMLCEFFDTQGESRPTHIVRDRDAKFTQEFCKKVEAAGIRFRPTPPRSPNLNPYAESWVGSIKEECLNHFMIFGERHLTYLIDEYLTHYHLERPHRGRENLPLNFEAAPTDMSWSINSRIHCRERLGGVLKHYEVEREAA